MGVLESFILRAVLRGLRTFDYNISIPSLKLIEETYCDSLALTSVNTVGGLLLRLLSGGCLSGKRL